MRSLPFEARGIASLSTGSHRLGSYYLAHPWRGKLAFLDQPPLAPWAEFLLLSDKVELVCNLTCASMANVLLVLLVAFDNDDGVDRFVKMKVFHQFQAVSLELLLQDRHCVGQISQGEGFQTHKHASHKEEKLSNLLL